MIHIHRCISVAILVWGVLGAPIARADFGPDVLVAEGYSDMRFPTLAFHESGVGFVAIPTDADIVDLYRSDDDGDTWSFFDQVVFANIAFSDVRLGFTDGRRLVSRTNDRPSGARRAERHECRRPRE